MQWRFHKLLSSRKKKKQMLPNILSSIEICLLSFFLSFWKWKWRVNGHKLSWLVHSCLSLSRDRTIVLQNGVEHVLYIVMNWTKDVCLQLREWNECWFETFFISVAFKINNNYDKQYTSSSYVVIQVDKNML